MRISEAGAENLSRGRRLMSFLALAALACQAQTKEMYLENYHALVAVKDDRDATVATTVELKPAAPPSELWIARYADQQVTQVTAQCDSGAISYTSDDSPGAVVFHLSDGDPACRGAAVHFEYSIHSLDRMIRIPLPVVNARPQPQQRPVLIEVILPPGMIAIGEGFPALAWRGQAHGEARLAAAPSVVVVDARAAGSVSWLNRFMTPAVLSTVAMIGLLLTGSVIWYAQAHSAVRRART
jgi:hypothetical protein